MTDDMVTPADPRQLGLRRALSRWTLVIEEMCQKFVCRLSGNLTNKASVSSIYRVLNTIYPCKANVSDISSLLAFVNWMKDRPDIADNTWFSDEAQFYLNAQVNKGDVILSFWKSAPFPWRDIELSILSKPADVMYQIKLYSIS